MLKSIWNFIQEFFSQWGTQPESSTPVPPVVTPELPKPYEPEVPKPVPPIKETREIPDFKFVDSSHHHPYVDPKKYKAPFLSHKCTQGTAMVDSKWATTKKICKDNNIPLSGYMFYECKQNWLQQVEHYMKTHGSFELPAQVDYETYKTKYSEQTEADLMKDKEELYLVLCELEKRTGMTPWLYVNYGAAGRLKFDPKFARFPVWFARYNSFLGPIPAPWTTETTAAWQFTEEGSFPGFPDGNDVNIYFGKVNVLNF